LFYYLLATSPFDKKQSSLAYRLSTCSVVTYFPTYLPIYRKGEKDPIKTDAQNHHNEVKMEGQRRAKSWQLAKKPRKGES
jgi:hypothetical protein